MVIGAFRHLQPVKALVVGDFMLDVYTTGRVSRISSEAPVPILLAEGQHNLPGGAGNVVLNLQALGAEVEPFGRLGDDHNGRLLRELFCAKKISVGGLLEQENYQTPVKNRFIADSQQLIRIDFEKDIPLSVSVEKQLIESLTVAISRSDIIAISDYGKGLLSDAVLSHVIACGKKKGIPIIVDPKGEDFTKYAGATMIKPNNKEAYAAAKRPLNSPIEEIGAHILGLVDIEMLLITRSEKGMILFDRNGKKKNFPVVQKDVKDVTGAGDTALAMITFAYANKVGIEHAIKLANIASGLAIEKLGCVCVSLSEIAERLLAVDAEGKVFDEKYLFVLKQALIGKKVVLLELQGHRELDQGLFHAIRRMGHRKRGAKLIAYVPLQSHKHFVTLLSSLPEIDFIVMQSENIEHLCSVITPERIYRLDNALV